MRPGLAVGVALAAQLARRERRCHRSVAQRHDWLSGQERVDAGVAVPGHHYRGAGQCFVQRPNVLLRPGHAADHADPALLERMRPKSDRQSVLGGRCLRGLHVPRRQVSTLQCSITLHLANQQHVLPVGTPWLHWHGQAPESRPEVARVGREGRPTVEPVPADAGPVEPVAQVAALEHQHIAAAPAMLGASAPAPAHDNARVLVQDTMAAQSFHHRLPMRHLVRRPLAQVEVHDAPSRTTPMPIPDPSATNSAT